MPTVPGWASHCLAVAVHEPVALAARVVLVDHRAEPLDHLLLDRDRAGGCGVDDALQRRHVVLRAGLLGQLEHAHEHRRHDLAVGDVILVDEAEVLLGIEVLHRHDRGPDAMSRQAEAKGSCVVEGCRGEITLRVVHAEQQLQESLRRFPERLRAVRSGTPGRFPSACPSCPRNTACRGRRRAARRAVRVTATRRRSRSSRNRRSCRRA